MSADTLAGQKASVNINDLSKSVEAYSCGFRLTLGQFKVQM
jgi:hypothetical protein